MTPTEKADLVLGSLQFARLVASQISMAELEEITPEKRAELLAVRDEVNEKLALVTPKD